MLYTIRLIVVILMIVGALPQWGYSSQWGYGPSGGLAGIVLLCIILWFFFGRGRM